MNYVSPNRKMLAEMLEEEHPGFPKDDPSVAVEVVESFFVAMRRFLLKERELHLEGIGKIKIQTIAGADKKRDARTGIHYKIPPRDVIKLVPSIEIKRLINTDRKPSEKIGSD